MITIQQIKPLLEQYNHPMLSLYLQVDPALSENQAATPAWRIWIKTALKDIDTCVPIDFADVWTTIRDKTETFLASYTPQCKTLALFYGQDFEQVFELPITLNNHITFGKLALANLLRAIDECKPYLLIFVTHKSARLCVVTCTRIEEYSELDLDINREEWHEMPLMPATAAGGLVRAGSHRDRFDKRVDEQVNHFYKQVAEKANKLGDTYAAEQVVLAGNDKGAHAVREHLGNVTSIGPISLAQHLSSEEIVGYVAPMVSQFRLDQDAALMQDVVQLAQVDGRIVLGKEVIHALQQHKVELLILPLSSTSENLVNELALEALLVGTQVKFVTGTAAASLIDQFGAAARLYYRVNAN